MLNYILTKERLRAGCFQFREMEKCLFVSTLGSVEERIGKQVNR